MIPLYQELAFLDDSCIKFYKEDLPHFIVPWHYHPEIEIMYILEGTGTRFVGDHIDRYQEGDVCMVGPKLPHEWRNDDAFFLEGTGLKASCLCLFFLKEVFEDNLIRLPEMYYIIAECGTPEESASALNVVRESRGIAYANAIQPAANYDQPKTDFQYDNTQTTRTYEVMKEYQKEYFSEGQLWFFYKRHNFRTFFTCPLNDVRSSYQWPLPDNETLFGNNN